MAVWKNRWTYCVFFSITIHELLLSSLPLSLLKTQHSITSYEPIKVKLNGIEEETSNNPIKMDTKNNRGIFTHKVPKPFLKKHKVTNTKNITEPSTKTQFKKQAIPDREMISQILDEFVKNEEYNKYDHVFHPGFREKLKRSKAMFSVKKRDSEQKTQITITGQGEDRLRLQINDQCWSVPKKSGSYPFDNRIWMLDFQCNKKKRFHLTNEKQYFNSNNWYKSNFNL